MNVFLVTQHFRPDDTSTSVFLTAIAEEIARDNAVVVLSGSRNSASAANPRVIEFPTWAPPKGALIQRGLAMLWSCIAAFALVLWRARADTPVLVVTTPFLLPYFTVLGARLRRAPTALVVYDLYPDVLVASGLTGENSWLARGIRWINRWMFSTVNSVVIIGRDMKKHVARYGARAENIWYIPHWSTLPQYARPIEPLNPFRKGNENKFIVGMSGNLGFTHDPETVFKAAQSLSGDASIHFLLSGWGVGWERLVAAQQSVKLPNVTLVERVSESELDMFLAAANVWVIPYRRNMAGISVPSRLYNLLAMGRPVMALAEPDSEHALMLAEHDAGWVVEPENADALAKVISEAASNPEEVAAKQSNALKILSERFSRNAAGNSYRELVKQLHSAQQNGAE